VEQNASNQDLLKTKTNYFANTNLGKKGLVPSYSNLLKFPVAAMEDVSGNNSLM
jgi:hypothetical protein